MGFSEKSQAFLVAAWHKELTGAFGERGRQAFIHAVKHYAMQRGSRMAQRAIRDGQPLTYATFCGYGEWAPSEEALQNGSASVMNVKHTMPDFVFHVDPLRLASRFHRVGCKRSRPTLLPVSGRSHQPGIQREYPLFHRGDQTLGGRLCVLYQGRGLRA